MPDSSHRNACKPYTELQVLHVRGALVVPNEADPQSSTQALPFKKYGAEL